jgi:hypothetical protein
VFGPLSASRKGATLSHVQADKAAVDDMDDLLQGLMVIRDHLNRNSIDEAKQVLEQVGHRLAALINECRAVRG